MTGIQKALGVSEEVWQAAELREQQVTMGGGTPCYQGEFLPSSHLFLLQFFPFSPLHKEAQAGAGSGDKKMWNGFSAP